MKENQPDDVKAVFDNFPARARKVLMAARARIVELADEEGVGPSTETLPLVLPDFLISSGVKSIV